MDCYAKQLGRVGRPEVKRLEPPKNANLKVIEITHAEKDRNQQLMASWTLFLTGVPTEARCSAGRSAVLR